MLSVLTFMQRALYQWPPTFWAPGTSSVERVFSMDRKGVVLRAACIPQMGLHLFAQTDFWHAADQCRSMDWDWGPLLYTFLNKYSYLINYFGLGSSKASASASAMSKVLKMITEAA
uniref:Uncharacterized protein n=1 Tax=Micrurus spixii TaxID=129469 RepID=A0A2D4LRV5_9SAUR